MDVATFDINSFNLYLWFLVLNSFTFKWSWWYKLGHSIFRVDPIYAFFIQWTPEMIDGDDNGSSAAERRFVVVDSTVDMELSKTSGSQKRHRKISKDWEVSGVHTHFIQHASFNTLHRKHIIYSRLWLFKTLKI